MKTNLKKRKKEILFGFVFAVYLRFLRTIAAAMTTTMITIAALTISKVSVETPEPGVGATVGEAETVAVGPGV